MANIAVLIGTGYCGEDILHKLPWIKHIEKNNDVYIASRIDPNIHLNENLKRLIGIEAFLDISHSFHELKLAVKDFAIIYNSEFFNRIYTNSDFDKLQTEFHISFNFIRSMDRRFFNRESFQDKRDQDELNRYLSGLTKFFYEFYKKNDISVLINTLEDDAFSVIAFYVAKRMNIRIIGFMGSRFPKKGFMFCDNFSDICEWNKELQDLNLKEIYQNNYISGKEIFERNKNYYKINSVNKRINGFLSVKNFNRYSKSIIENYDCEKFIFPYLNLSKQITQYIMNQVRIIIFNHLSTKIKAEEKYFLFPLHYTEDAQITFREPLMDQKQILRQISRSIPSGYILYVKPHPHYLGCDIKISDFLELKKIKNIKILDPRILPFEAIKNSQAIITINSTTGFEALFFSKPVITLGSDFYCKDDICEVVHDPKELPTKIMDSFSSNKSVLSKKFVEKIFANTIWITGKTYPYGFSGLLEEDGKNIAYALNIILNKKIV